MEDTLVCVLAPYMGRHELCAEDIVRVARVPLVPQLARRVVPDAYLCTGFIGVE